MNSSVNAFNGAENAPQDGGDTRRQLAETQRLETMTIDQAIANLKESLQAAYAAEDRLKGLLEQNGLLS